MSKVHSVRVATCVPLLAALCVLFWAPPASADTIGYTVTATYDSSTTPGGPVIAPDTLFQFKFSEQSTLMSLDTAPVPITYTLGGAACSVCPTTGEVQFFPLNLPQQLGLFNIVLNTTDGDTYLWQFYGPQIYSPSGGGGSLMTGTFDINSSPQISTVDNTTMGQGNFGVGPYTGTFTGGMVVATSTAALPEPSSLLLLSTGLLGLCSLLRRFVRL